MCVCVCPCVCTERQTSLFLCVTATRLLDKSTAPHSQTDWWKCINTLSIRLLVLTCSQQFVIRCGSGEVNPANKWLESLEPLLWTTDKKKKKRKKERKKKSLWQMYFSWEQPNLIIEGDEGSRWQGKCLGGGTVCVCVCVLFCVSSSDVAWWYNRAA